MLSLLALSFSTNNIGGLIMLFVGLVIAAAIVFAIMKAVNAPGWLYTVAAVGGLVLLLIIVIAIFFGDASVRVSP